MPLHLLPFIDSAHSGQVPHPSGRVRVTKTSRGVDFPPGPFHKTPDDKVNLRLPSRHSMLSFRDGQSLHRLKLPLLVL
jgi:hypothetical protein